jgi:hypothetical protein
MDIGLQQQDQWEGNPWIQAPLNARLYLPEYQHEFLGAAF